jgi:hypothetical protein
MVDKVNGKAAAGEFLGKDLDFYTLTMEANLDIETTLPAAPTPVAAPGEEPDVADFDGPDDAAYIAAKAAWDADVAAYAAYEAAVVDHQEDVAAEMARAKAALVLREKVIETISLNGQPIILGNFNAVADTFVLKFAIEHRASWQDGETSLLAADAERGTLVGALAEIGIADAEVEKHKTL